jgi:hypothetical protein
MTAEICANCGLDCAAFKVEANGEIYCRAYCAGQAALAEAEAAVSLTARVNASPTPRGSASLVDDADGAAIAVRSARRRVLGHAKRHAVPR